MKKYLMISNEGHNPMIEEQDINHAFNMEKRIEKFNLGLDSINAHTLKIIEIIEEEKNILQRKNQEDLFDDLEGLN